MSFLSIEWIVLQIFLICCRRKELHFWKRVPLSLTQCSKRATTIFAPHRKGGKMENPLISLLLLGIFFELESLAPLFFSRAVIIGLFFGTDLIIELHSKSFSLVYSFIIVRFPSKRERRERQILEEDSINLNHTIKANINQDIFNN